MLPVECVVRGYLSGSGWKDYQRTGAVSGIELPRGPARIRSASRADLHAVDQGRASATTRRSTSSGAVELIGDRELAERVRDVSIAVYEHAAEHARERGIILADTKFEFGLDADGELTLGDEVCTPDSSRFWPADQYEPGRGQPSFDKQFVARLGLLDRLGPQPAGAGDPRRRRRRTREKYIEAYERITGEPFDALAAAEPGAELMRARVLVRPKAGILDPQGQAVERALPALGFEGVRNVHVGRLIELDVEDPAQLPEMCEQLLANPLIEDYEIVEDDVKFGVVRFPGSCDDIDALWRGRAGRRGRAPVARRPRPPGRRRRDRPRRLLLRRLPARGRDRALCPGDGGGR